MQNPQQTVPLDAMVSRLEKANALAYEQSARVENVLRPEQDIGPGLSEQQKRPAIPDRGSSRRMPAFLGLAGLLLVTSVCVAVFAWQSTYADAAKLIIARWANADLLRPTSLAAAPMSPELAQRLQTMARDLANLEQLIRATQGPSRTNGPRQYGGQRAASKATLDANRSRQRGGGRAAQGEPETIGHGLWRRSWPQVLLRSLCRCISPFRKPERSLRSYRG